MLIILSLFINFNIWAMIEKYMQNLKNNLINNSYKNETIS
jgi:hypothetical protein